MLVDELKTAAVATMRRNLQGISKCVNLLDEGELWKDFTYRNPERTLTDAEVNAAHETVVKQLEHGLSAVIR